MKLHPVRSADDVRLADADATARGKAKHGDALEEAIRKELERLTELQRVFYADARHSLLIVLQGRDAAGKDGTIRHVFSAVDPQGCTVASFTPPTDIERAHDYLWRVHQQVPPRRMIGIFNRSHYEDVIVPRVHGLLSKKICSARYDQINAFEQMLVENGVVILKFFLHVSRAEQRKRLAERLADRKKNWKFREGDLDDRQRWRAFTDAYRDVLVQTSTKWAPWRIVPADDKHMRNWLIARTITDTLEALDLRYPVAEPAVLNLEID